MSDIRVLIIANDPLARAGLASLISEQPGCIVVGRVPGDARLASELDLYHADTAVWDLGWDWLSEDGSSRTDLTPISDVIEAGLPLVVLIPNDELTASLWGIGVRGILMRDSRPEQIAAALASMVNELAVLDTTLVSQITAPIPSSDLSPVDALTAREMEVLRFIAEGYSNKAIAQALAISEHTVKFHINSLMSKLNAQSRTEAVVRATRLGLITL